MPDHAPSPEEHRPPPVAYEKANTELGMSPARHRRGSPGDVIRYGVGTSRFGPLLIAATERGICSVSLGHPRERLILELEGEFPRAVLREAPEAFAPWLEVIVDHLADPCPGLDLPVDLTGTEFQIRVWRALREIPDGETRSYRQVAESIGRPSAARAVAHACATNKVALIVPCHRVVREDGRPSGYRWGIEVKRELLRRERKQKHR